MAGRQSSSSLVADTATECNIPIVIKGRISFAGAGAVPVKFIRQKISGSAGADEDSGDAEGCSA
jgi:hypothetical protein